MGWSQLWWQFSMPTPTELSCTHCMWVSLNANTRWLVTTLSREELHTHTGSRGWRRGLRAVHTMHLPAHTSSPALAEPDACPCFLPISNRRKKLHTGIAATSPGKGASPNVGPNSRREKCPSPPCKPLLPECSFPGKFHLAALLCLLYKKRNQLQDLVEYV